MEYAPFTRICCFAFSRVLLLMSRTIFCLSGFGNRTRLPNDPHVHCQLHAEFRHKSGAASMLTPPSQQHSIVATAPVLTIYLTSASSVRLPWLLKVTGSCLQLTGNARNGNTGKQRTKTKRKETVREKENELRGNRRKRNANKGTEKKRNGHDMTGMARTRKLKERAGNGRRKKGHGT